MSLTPPGSPAAAGPRATRHRCAARRSSGRLSESKHVAPLDHQLRQGADGHRAGLPVVADEAVVVVFQNEDGDVLLAGRHDPVFADAAFFVEGELFVHIAAGRTGREDFDNPVGGTQAPPLIEFGGVTDDAQIGLHHGRDGVVGAVAAARGQAHIERRCKYLARLAAQIRTDKAVQIAGYALVQGGRRGAHPANAPAYQFYPFRELPRQVISVRVRASGVEVSERADRSHTPKMRLTSKSPRPRNTGFRGGGLGSGNCEGGRQTALPHLAYQQRQARAPLTIDVQLEGVAAGFLERDLVEMDGHCHGGVLAGGRATYLDVALQLGEYGGALVVDHFEQQRMLPGFGFGKAQLYGQRTRGVLHRKLLRRNAVERADDGELVTLVGLGVLAKSEDFDFHWKNLSGKI